MRKSDIESQKYFSAWNTAIKLTWNVPRATRTYFVQEILCPNLPSMKTRVLSKFHGFFLNLLSNDSKEIQVAARISARDVRRNLGSNVRYLQDMTGWNPWDSTKREIKETMRTEEMVHVSVEDEWRLPYLQRILLERMTAHFQSNQEEEERLQSLINSLTIN